MHILLNRIDTSLILEEKNIYLLGIPFRQKGTDYGIKRNIIQTKHVEFVEDVYGYEYIYSKKILETPFTNANNIDK